MNSKRNGFYVIVAFVVLSLTACNTMEGAGRDTQDAGKWMEEQGEDDDD